MTSRTLAADWASAHLLPIAELTIRSVAIARGVRVGRRARTRETRANARRAPSVDAIDVMTFCISGFSGKGTAHHRMKRASGAVSGDVSECLRSLNGCGRMGKVTATAEFC